MKEDKITEYHCCCECKQHVDIPCHEGYETGCLHPRGKPNKSGGLCRCNYFDG